jgi:hypothetical protein
VEGRPVVRRVEHDPPRDVARLPHDHGALGEDHQALGRHARPDVPPDQTEAHRVVPSHEAHQAIAARITLANVPTRRSRLAVGAVGGRLYAACGE